MAWGDPIQSNFFPPQASRELEAERKANNSTNLVW